MKLLDIYFLLCTMNMEMILKEHNSNVEEMKWPSFYLLLSDVHGRSHGWRRTTVLLLLLGHDQTSQRILASLMLHFLGHQKLSQRL